MSSKRKRSDGLPENPLEGLPLTGALGKQVEDSTVVNQLSAKEGGAIKRKKPTSLGVLIEAGIIKDGALLRYMKGTGLSYSGKLMAVGRARMEGVEVHGNSALLGMSGFEAYAKSTAHRPAQFSFTSNGLSLQQLQQQHAGDGGASVRKPPGKWGMTAEGRDTHYPAPALMSDLNDEVCRICWQGAVKCMQGDLLCCETCPAVMHAQCAGLAEAPRGDWHCPSCTCATCGHAATSTPEEPLPPQATLLEPETGADAPVWRGPLSGEKAEAALTMSAYAFDTLWPREGALAARMQLQAQEQADRAAQAAAQLRGRPPSARLAQRGPSTGAEAPAERSSVALVKEEPAMQPPVPSRSHIEQLSLGVKAESGREDMAMPQPGSNSQGMQGLLHVSAPAAGANHQSEEAVAAMGRQTVAEPVLSASPRRIPKSPPSFRAPAGPTGDAVGDTALRGKLQRAAKAAHSRQEVTSILDDMFPPTNSATKGKALREAFAAVCPGEPWKGRVIAIRLMAESLWDLRSGAMSDNSAPAQQSERPRRRGAGALMSAALAAELSSDAALDDGPLQPHPAAAAGGFLQVDGADDCGSADEQLPDASAEHVVVLRPPAEFSGPSHAEPQAESSLPGLQMGSQTAGSEGQRLIGNEGAVPAASSQAGMPPYPAVAQLPSAQLLGGQHAVPHADTLTAALQEQVSALSRVLGPSEGVRQALQRQMIALQHNAACQVQGAPAAHPGAYMAPGMPVQVPVYHASPPEQAAQPAVQAGASQPATLKRAAAPALSKPTGAPKRAKHAAAAAPSCGTEPAQSDPRRPAPLVAQAPNQASVQAGPPVSMGGAADGLGQSLSHALDTDLAAQRPLSAGFESAAEAQAAFGRPTAPAGQPPAGPDAALVSCAGCGARRHVGCLAQEAQQQAKLGIWFHSETCRAVDAHMARLAVSGLMPFRKGDDVPHAPSFAWQLIRGAAVSSPEDCQGHAPHYEEGTRETLRETLYAVRHLFHETMGPLQDSRTGQDLLPGLLQGRVLRRGLLDFSGFHTAVLWLGPSIVAAGVIRALGTEVAELPALAVRPELQGNTLGRLLLAALEDVLRAAGVKLVAMPALVPFPTSSPRQDMASDELMSAPSTNEQIPSWARAMGYRQATCSQLARMSALPILHFLGAQFAVKELSDAMALKVKAPTELHFSEEADEQEYWRARLLQPTGLAAYTEQQARMESQNPPAAVAEQPDQAAGEADLASHAEVPEEAAAAKSEPKDELTMAVKGMTAVGSLGRVKVPRAGFKQ